MLQQRVNALTGESEWILVSDGDDGDASDALAESLYLDMLNDRARNTAFSSAIAKLGRHGHVLDIGAGSGLLSMMAWRAMEKQCQVTACESFLPMYKLARKVCRDNGTMGAIKLLHMRSDEIKVGVDISSRADALVCEILDSELLGEGIIPSLRHAHKHLLQPNAATVPYRATVYAQLVECDFLWRFHDLQGVEAQLQDGMAFSPEDFYSYFKHRQHAFHVDEIPGIKLLSEPFEAFTLDFYRAPDVCGQFTRAVHVNMSGTAHAIVSWWVLQLDKDGLICYSTAPRWVKGASDWCDHWKQCVWFLPGQGISVEQHSELCLVVSHDETSVRYDINGGGRCNSFASGFKLSPQRCCMLGDGSRRSIIRSAIQKALGEREVGNCLILDDGLMSAVCALSTVHGSCHVAGLFPGCRRDGLKYLASVASKLSIIHKDVKHLTRDDFKGHKVDVLLAEPYYATYEHALPWKQLRFWYERTTLSPLLSENPIIVPCLGILYGMACYLPDLWQSRCCLEGVEGFDHSSVNSMLGACGNLPDGQDSPILPFSIWQCGRHESLTKPFPLLEFNMREEIHSLSVFAKVTFVKSGLCHGVVLWMDWVMDPENKDLVLSTGHVNPSGSWCWKQGVKLFRTPLQVTETLELNASFNSQSGEISVTQMV
ncbi:protein arginine N-methyltransferase 1.6 isoform X1 [Selaginella moellendorffii]|uniref:protein arginine N-methyltransferase 1.6 isoform X1 n=1 Tax=Selaginella moellendorffii TaxID=88036 RepID=UPI000D1C92FC|nr:protein arginine N-methyltransferase 1.6 isoform X1 [Selaginella moellendorffii]|eukprot:XP_024521901.1 protein arginine N-methyltransferase 1.6 isoform X1 [Selaginella moellendorffii]